MYDSKEYPFEKQKSKVIIELTKNYKEIELMLLKHWINKTVAEFKEFERRVKFKPRFKYGWFHLKLYQMFQDLIRR